MKRGYIYKITNLINGKIYIGKSTRCDDYHLNTYYGSGLVIQQALKKYGKENFKKDILEFIDFDNEDELDNREIFYIKKYNSLNESIGYNRSPGGEGGGNTEQALKGWETRRQHGLTKLSEEHKRKISLSNKNKPKSEIHKKHLSEHHRSRKEKTVVFEDGHTEITADPIWKIAERVGLSEIKLRRASEYDKFRNGIKVKELVNEKLVKQHDMIENGIFEDPFTHEELTYMQLRIRKSFNEKYKNINLLTCFARIKKEKT